MNLIFSCFLYSAGNWASFLWMKYCNNWMQFFSFNAFGKKLFWKLNFKKFWRILSVGRLTTGFEFEVVYGPKTVPNKKLDSISQHDIIDKHRNIKTHQPSSSPIVCIHSNFNKIINQSTIRWKIRQKPNKKLFIDL